MLITMHSLDHMREHFIQLAHANSTQANMLSHRKSYITFCTNYKLTPFPIHALTAARYIVALHTRAARSALSRTIYLA